MMRRALVSWFLLLCSVAIHAASGTQRYVITLERGAGAPDVAKFGGTVEAQTPDTLVVSLSAPAAEALRATAGVQRVVAADGKSAADALHLTKNVSGPTWSSGTYSYDASGNITQIGPGNDQKSSTFLYDPSSRLVSASIGRIDGDRTERYVYNPFGSMTTRYVNGTEKSFGTVSSTTNRLDGRSYDEAGNMINNGAGEVYTYDGLNQMTTKVPSGGGWDETYVYSPSDERIGAKVAGSGYWTWSLRDFDGKVLRQYKSDATITTGTQTSWTWVEDYVWQNGQLIGGERSSSQGGRRHFHVDHLGSPRLITNQSGQQISLHDYSPYGEEITSIVQEPAAGLDREDPMNFTGHERDFAHGGATENTNYVDYMHARYYSATVGRFLSVDPVIPKAAIGAPQMWNRYSYVANNPVNRIDPDGRLLQALAGDAGSAADAFKRLQRLVGDDAAKYLKLNAKTGIVTLSGISRLAYGVRFGKTAGMVASLITAQGHTATFALSNSAFAKGGGGGRTEPTATGTRTEIGPGLIPKTAGGVAQNVETTLAHELGHAFQDMYGLKPGAPGFGKMNQRYWVNPHEAFGMWSENNYRSEAGLPHRSYYWYGPEADYGNDYIEP